MKIAGPHLCLVLGLPRLVLSLMTAVIALAVCASAQDVRLAEVKGEVLDMQGKPIAAAQVVYTNVANNKTYRCQTAINGQYYMIGLQVGAYQIEITGPTGRHIYSGKKVISAGDAQKLNVTHIDLSSIPTKASLAPFKGPSAAELQSEDWRKVTESNSKALTPEQTAQVRQENSTIARYNELVPLAQDALKDQDWPRAADLLQQLVAIAPFKWELYQNLGTAQRSLGKREAALQSLEKGIAVLRNDPDARKDRAKADYGLAQMMLIVGELYSALEKPEQAAANFREAAKLDPKPGIAYIHLCGAEYNQGNADAALQACAKAIKSDPERTAFYQTTASIQSNLGRFDEAIKTYEKGIGLAESNIQVNRRYRSNITSARGTQINGTEAEAGRMGQMLLSQGNAYFQIKDYKHAADVFARSVKLHPFPALPLFNLCATLYDMDNLAGAADACHRATVVDPKMADAYFVEAYSSFGVAARQGKMQAPQGTKEALEKYLELAPDGLHAEDARQMLKQIAAN